MIVAMVYFSMGLWAAMSSLALFAPRRAPHGLRALLALSAMFLSWAALYWLAFDALLILLGAVFGAAQHPLARLGMALWALAFFTLSVWLYKLSVARPVLDGRAVLDHEDPLHGEGSSAPRGEGSFRPMLTFHTPAMEGVKLTKSVVFHRVGGRELSLDIYSPPEALRATNTHTVSASKARPCVLYIHGGGWAAGYRRQSRFLHYELAAEGSVVFTVSYRFAPRFTLPAAVEDVKAAVAWVKAHARDYGAEAETVVVVGSSAGAQLAAMVALSPNVPEFQPGFETADCRVHGAVLLYGVYDFEAQAERDAMIAWWLRWVVLGASKAANPGMWRLNSPLRWISPEAPPVLIAHGTHDGLVSPEESEAMVSELRSAGGPRVHHLVAPMGLHAFEAFPSPMQRRAVRVIAAFVRSVQRRP